MSVSVKCPRCHKHTAVSPEQLWKTLACPGCGCRFIAETSPNQADETRTPAGARPRSSTGATASARDTAASSSTTAAEATGWPAFVWFLGGASAVVAVAVLWLAATMVGHRPPAHDGEAKPPSPALANEQATRATNADESVASAEPPKKVVADIVASPQIDERLFLLRVLETMYEQWPATGSSPAEFAAATAELRRQAIQFKQHAVDAELDHELPELFSDFVTSLDAYTQFLVAIDRIEKSATTQSTTDEFGSGFNGGVAGRVTFDAMRASDYSGKQAAGAALAVGLVSYLFDSWQRAEARDAAKQQLVAQESQKTSDTIYSSLLRAQNQARALAVRHGWQKEEVGFELSPEQSKHVTTLGQNGDVDGLLHFAQEQVVLRPRDPFVRVYRNVLASCKVSATSAELIPNAEDCMTAATLVPAPPIYDRFRADCVMKAALIAAAAREQETFSAIEPYGSTSAGEFAVALWRKKLEYEPSDPTGDVREELVFSLTQNSQLDEAATIAAQISNLRGSSPDFQYVMACLRTRRGELPMALTHLRLAIRGGAADIQEVKHNPHLVQLRQQRNREFDQLTTVKWRWSVVWGILNDDIQITNDSEFALTNVTVNVRLEQDGRVWSPQLTAAAIQPGQVYKWPNVVSIPNRRITSSKIALTCDQNRETSAAE